jgi:hypothetical protein
MLGSSGILALCIFAAGPTQSAAASDRPDTVVTRESFQQAAYQENTAKSRPTKSNAARPLPPDPAYDKPQALVAQSKEGIPGLPGLPETPEKTATPPAKQKKPAPDSDANPMPPPPKGDVTPPAKLDAAIGGADLQTCPPAEVHGRPARPGSLHRWLDAIDFDAWLDQGATINTLSPRNRMNGPVTFNNRSNDYQFNQAYLRLKRDVNTQGDLWDVGGRIDLLYGADSIYTEARGLELTDDLAPKWNAQQYGLALPQAYAEVFAPWGPGIDLKLGHFYSDFGYESVAAPDNFFYSHSYEFQYGEPKTYTGFVGESTLGAFTFRAGMTRGWDNWEDNNNDLGFTGGIGWSSCSERTNISFEITTGREQPDPGTNVRTLYSLVMQQRIGERWQYVFQHDLGSEPAAGADGRDANWYGITQYLYRTINERWKAGMRVEWFRDVNGSRVPGIRQTADFYELSAGLNWTPTQHVVVRPELRWDWTGTPDVYPFGDGARSNQLLLDCDVIVRF